MKISFLPALTLLFIGLKLTNVIDWSWIWVLSPLWLPFAAVFGAACLFFGFVFAIGVLAAIVGD